MATGDVLTTPSVAHPIARPNVMGPRKAMVKAIAAYLMGLKFVVDDGEGGAEYLRLNKVFERWPKHDEDLEVPSASIVDTTGNEHLAHNFTPTLLEETAGEFDCLLPGSAPSPRTVLMKEGDCRNQLQIDFWTATEPDRQAVEALLSSAFNLDEDRSGIVIEAPKEYYSRGVRVTLMDTKDDDTPASAQRNELRLRCLFVAECDIVSLRQATLMATPQVCVVVEDPNDPVEGV